MMCPAGCTQGWTRRTTTWRYRQRRATTSTTSPAALPAKKKRARPNSLVCLPPCSYCFPVSLICRHFVPCSLDGANEGIAESNVWVRDGCGELVHQEPLVGDAVHHPLPLLLVRLLDLHDVHVLSWRDASGIQRPASAAVGGHVHRGQLHLGHHGAVLCRYHLSLLHLLFRIHSRGDGRSRLAHHVWMCVLCCCSIRVSKQSILIFLLLFWLLFSQPISPRSSIWAYKASVLIGVVSFCFFVWICSPGGGGRKIFYLDR